MQTADPVMIAAAAIPAAAAAVARTIADRLESIAAAIRGDAARPAAVRRVPGWPTLPADLFRRVTPLDALVVPPADPVDPAFVFSR